MPTKADTYPLYFGLIRTERVMKRFLGRAICIGWKLWFQNGAHYVWMKETGMRRVRGPVAA